MKISRGLRNYNPLNIRRNSTKWKGLAEVQSDKEFFSFKEMAWGYRAAFITLRNYRLKHGIATLSAWISRWAPPVENDTAAYIRFVSDRSGIAPEEEPCIDDAETMCAIVAAMSQMENGIQAVMFDVRKGWNLACR
jgi:hypothetical protein